MQSINRWRQRDLRPGWVAPAASSTAGGKRPRGRPLGSGSPALQPTPETLTLPQSARPGPAAQLVVYGLLVEFCGWIPLLEPEDWEEYHWEFVDVEELDDVVGGVLPEPEVLDDGGGAPDGDEAEFCGCGPMGSSRRSPWRA